MAVQAEIHARLCSIADNIWDATDHDEEFALLGEPVDILNIAEDLPPDVEENDSEHYDEPLPWGLESDLLIQMVWEWGLPFSHRTDLTAVVLPSGRRLYVLDIEEVCTKIVSVTSTDWSPGTDANFLRRLLRDNGASFGTQVITGAPHCIGTSLKSSDSLVGTFVSLFTAAGQHCWTELGNYAVRPEEDGQLDKVATVAAYLRDALGSHARLLEDIE